jgi:hypothetical protein
VTSAPHFDSIAAYLTTVLAYCLVLPSFYTICRLLNPEHGQSYNVASYIGSKQVDWWRRLPRQLISMDLLIMQSLFYYFSPIFHELDAESFSFDGIYNPTTPNEMASYEQINIKYPSYWELSSTLFELKFYKKLYKCSRPLKESNQDQEQEGVQIRTQIEDGTIGNETSIWPALSRPIYTILYYLAAIPALPFLIVNLLNMLFSTRCRECWTRTFLSYSEFLLTHGIGLWCESDVTRSHIPNIIKRLKLKPFLEKGFASEILAGIIVPRYCLKCSTTRTLYLNSR